MAIGKDKQRFRTTFLRTAFRPSRHLGPLLAAMTLALAAAPSLSGQTAACPSDNAATARPADVFTSNAPPSGALAQAGIQSEPAAGDQLATTPQQPATAGNKRRLDVNPVTGVVSSPGSNYQPLKGKERWKLYWKQNYWSIGAYFGPVLTALVLDQATGTPAQWGGGLPGFGRRLASRTGSAIVQGSVQAPLAALLHEDVRYISSARSGGKRRALHAAEYTFLTYTNQGHATPNIANLAGYYASTAVSTLWLPGRYDVARYTLTNATEQIALSVPVNIVQEFWPEITRKILHRHP